MYLRTKVGDNSIPWFDFNISTRYGTYKSDFDSLIMLLIKPDVLSLILENKILRLLCLLTACPLLRFRPVAY